MARVYHELARSGTFSANVKTITRVTISDSALSQRAFSIGWKLIDEILSTVLRPLADIDRHPGPFHRGYRLLAMDGTRFNLRNTLRLREIHADIHYAGGEKPMAIRLWTTLLDEVEHPAAELVELYATRWEEELFFRELKSHLHGGDNLLDAQTPETAAQEMLAMLLAASVVAMQREAVAARAEVEILRISFAKVLHKTAALCELLAVGADLIAPESLGKWIERILDDLATSALIQKRKPRSCPRTLRQPVKDWPKTKTPGSKSLTKTITITNP
jgi:hypothetical protein